MRTFPSLSALLAALLILSGCAGSNSSFNSADDSPQFMSQNELTDLSPPPAQPPSTAATVDQAIYQIRWAIDVGVATDAYARGLAIDPNNVSLHREYVRKAIELGVPQVAAIAAQHILSTQPDDGLARAVVAYSNARQGRMADALMDISVAARQAADDPFVQRTAAYLIAWYDNNPQPPTLAPNVRRSLQDIHTALDNKPVFASAFQEAGNFYRDQQTRAAAEPAPAASQPPQTGDFYGSAEPAAGLIYPSNPPDWNTASPYDYGAWPDDYAYDLSPYCGGLGWGPWFWPGCFAVIDFDFHHHHHHDFDHGRFHHWGDGDHRGTAGRDHHHADQAFRDRFFGSHGSRDARLAASPRTEILGRTRGEHLLTPSPAARGSRSPRSGSNVYTPYMRSFGDVGARSSGHANFGSGPSNPRINSGARNFGSGIHNGGSSYHGGGVSHGGGHSGGGGGHGGGHR